MNRENYDPNQHIGDMDQSDYNQALRHAIKYNNKQNMKKVRSWIWVYMTIYFIFFIWALMLAMKTPMGPERTMHITLALVFAPAYVIAHYMGNLAK